MKKTTQITQLIIYLKSRGLFDGNKGNGNRGKIKTYLSDNSKYYSRRKLLLHKRGNREIKKR